ncbi:MULTISPECIES: host specificity factor TipJ family phage tail protein [Aurantimonas]|uniref:host specificity factor TipJ family phage tail protein n=1 Tax=Aurantimonas TaxID=182269 RepID=UPI003513BD74
MTAIATIPKPVTVLALPSIDPTRGRIEMMVTEGMTIAEMVSAAFPSLSAGRLSMVRVLIGDWTIAAKHWRRVKPKPGMSVVIRIVPQGSAIKNVLSVVVSVAAIALGQFYVGPLLAGALGFTAGSIGATATTALATAAFAFAGNALLNALIPTARNDGRSESPTYSVEGWKNARNPNGPVPFILGRHRVALPLAASSFTESIGDNRYITTMTAAYGPLQIEDIRIGDTPIAEFEAGVVDVQVRNGYASDAPISIYPQQVVEDQVGVELETSKEGEQPVTRVSAADAAELSIDLGFPGGLYDTNDEGDTESHSMILRIEHRIVSGTTWLVVSEQEVRAKTRKPFTRTFRWTPPTRARYEVRLTRVDDGDSSENASELTQWICLRAHRPEYPLNFDKPLAIVAAKVKATKLTNGTLDELNFIGTCICLDWDAGSGTWITRSTRNPASLYRYVLQGPFNARPKTDAQIDLVQLQDWHAWCAAKGLTYDRVHDYDATFEEVLMDVCRAGRATPSNDGTKWGVVIDRPQTTVVTHIGPRNSWNFKGRITPTTLPDAWRIPFSDETYQYENAERVVPRPGFVGDPVNTEELPMIGVTNPDIVWKEGRRRFYELDLRYEEWSVQQDVESLVAVRGSLVVLSQFRNQTAGLVKAVRGNTIVLDEQMTMEAGESYACRFRLTDGSSVLRSVATRPGTSRLVRVTGDGDLPEVGNMAFFGKLGNETTEAIVKDVENGEDLSALLTLIPHAPEIDALVDADVPPAWDGRVGSDVVIDIAAPGVPVIVDVLSGEAARESGDVGYPPIRVLLTATGTTRVTSYEARHRLQGAGTWSGPLSAFAISSKITITGYDKDDVVEIQARSVGQTGLTSDWSSTTTETVGVDDPPPLALATGLSTSVSGFDVTVQWTNPNDPRIAAARAFRTAAGVAFSTSTPASDFLYYGPNVVAAIDNAVPTIAGNGDIQSGQQIVYNVPTASLSVGMRVFGTGIPAGTTIQAIYNATSLNLSLAATATASGASLTFSAPSYDYWVVVYDGNGRASDPAGPVTATI